MHIMYWFKKKQLRRIWRRTQRHGPIPLACCFMGFIVGLHTTLFYLFEKGAQSKLSLFDSFWVTMTTITTVGYGDISAKTVEGRWTTMFLGYFLGLGLFAWLAGEVASHILERLEKRRQGMLSIKSDEHIFIINFPNESKVRQLIEQLRSVQQTTSLPLVLINNQCNTLPFQIDQVSFVRGDPTDPATYEKASIEFAKQAIVLASDPSDPTTDALTAAIISTIENINPEVKTVAECVSEKHINLFRHVQCDHIVFTGDFVTKLLVQETQDEGTSNVISRLLDRREGNELYSLQLQEPALGQSFRALSLALMDFQTPIISIGLLRNQQTQINPDPKLLFQKDDRLLFISEQRLHWSDLETHLQKTLHPTS